MAKNRVINSRSFHDGRVLLYQLAGRPQKKWLCRIKIPNGPGYIYRGTGTSVFYEARKFADELFDELRFKIKTGQAVTGQRIKKLISEFEASYSLEASSTNRAESICEFLKTYAVEYFAKSSIIDLDENEVSRFFDWRRKNFKKKTPSNSTVASEVSKFQVFADWCYKRGHIKKPISLNRPTVKDNRRPHFDDKDWRKLTRFLREWEKNGSTKSGPIYRDRVMLTNYVLILANTGIRVGEARTLKWSDVDTFVGDDDKDNVVLQVRGKTGSREVVARTNNVKDYLKRIWDLRVEELNKTNSTKETESPEASNKPTLTPSLSEAIFCHKDGKPIHSFKKGFNALIKEAKVEYDAEGQRRVIYSLRHTYATFRLHEGVNHFSLARNMGTSVKMLESFYGHTSNRAMASELTKTRKKESKKLPWQ